MSAGYPKYHPSPSNMPLLQFGDIPPKEKPSEGVPDSSPSFSSIPPLSPPVFATLNDAPVVTAPLPYIPPPPYQRAPPTKSLVNFQPGEACPPVVHFVPDIHSLPPPPRFIPLPEPFFVHGHAYPPPFPPPQCQPFPQQPMYRPTHCHMPSFPMAPHPPPQACPSPPFSPPMHYQVLSPLPPYFALPSPPPPPPRPPHMHPSPMAGQGLPFLPASNALSPVVQPPIQVDGSPSILPEMPTLLRQAPMLPPPPKELEAQPSELLQPGCSKLLLEFKTNLKKRWELKDVRGHIAEFSRDQRASRFIQQVIEDADTDALDLIWSEVASDDLLTISFNACGNYVVQKLLDQGSEAQRVKLATALQGHVVQVSQDAYGCWVIQKVLDVVPNHVRGQIVLEAEPHILTLVKDPNGNHVVQKFLQVVPARYLTFVDAFHGRAVEIARDNYGCRVLQRCLQHLPFEAVQPLLQELKPFILEMICDQFGNYVIQHILQDGKTSEKEEIFHQIRGRVLRLARHKYASNVLEKALTHAPPLIRHAIIEEMLTTVKGFPKGVWQLMNDQYGNYVLQKALTLAEEPQRTVLSVATKCQLSNVRAAGKARAKQMASIQQILQGLEELRC